MVPQAVSGEGSESIEWNRVEVKCREVISSLVMSMNSKRFDRQVRFAPLGPQGQRRLEGSSVLLVGCGALGSSIAQSLTRAGVGELRLVDRDIVEESNLPRQVLFEDLHAREGWLKVDASRAALERIGGPTRIVTHAQHLDADTIEELAEGCDLILDGTDNLGTRYLVNDYCVQNTIPWVYGGVVGSGGLVLTVLPGRGPCLRCVFDSPPPTGSLPTCDTAGVIQPAVGAIASMQAGQALRVLSETPETPKPLIPALLEIDVWSGSLRRLVIGRQEDCVCCGQREFTWLDEPIGRRATILCGRNTVQVRSLAGNPDLDRLEAVLAPLASSVKRAGPILRVVIEEFTLTVFEDGRALIEGTDDIDRAIAIYDRYIGS
ncbi:MAG: molybdopterin/thiamine biosynthesis adenylyltransferase [Planctomycetota bacterium]